MATRSPKPAYAQLLSDTRLEYGFSVEEVAKVLAVGDSTYRNAESGRSGPKVMARLGLVFPEEADQINALWKQHIGEHTPAPLDALTADQLLIPLELMHGLAEARVTRFHPSRRYYRMLRDGRESISSYIASAEHTVEIISMTLATGMELERVVDTFEAMLTRKQPVNIHVSLLDPELPYLMQSIAPVLASPASTLAARISDTLSYLSEFRAERLSNANRHLFSLGAHACIPNASAILLDGDADSGRIQLETKGYKMGMDKSFGFEVAAPSEFFSDLRDSYRHLIRDGRKLS